MLLHLLELAMSSPQSPRPAHQSESPRRSCAGAQQLPRVVCTLARCCQITAVPCSRATKASVCPRSRQRGSGGGTHPGSRQRGAPAGQRTRASRAINKAQCQPCCPRSSADSAPRPCGALRVAQQLTAHSCLDAAPCCGAHNWHHALLHARSALRVPQACAHARACGAADVGAPHRTAHARVRNSSDTWPRDVYGLCSWGALLQGSARAVLNTARRCSGLLCVTVCAAQKKNNKMANTPGCGLLLRN